METMETEEKFSILLRDGEVNEFAKAMGPIMAIESPLEAGALFVVTNESLRVFRLNGRHTMLASIYLNFADREAKIREEINFPVSGELLASLLKAMSIAGSEHRELKLTARGDSCSIVYSNGNASLEYAEEYNENIEILEPRVDYPYGDLVDPRVFASSVAKATKPITLEATQKTINVSYSLGDVRNTLIKYSVPVEGGKANIPAGTKIMIPSEAAKVLKTLRRTDGVMVRFKPSDDKNKVAPLKIGYKVGQDKIIAGYLMVAPIINE